jgi:hypothetical protein
MITYYIMRVKRIIAILAKFAALWNWVNWVLTRISLYDILGSKEK